MEPKLTPSERGYLFNRDGFLAGIKERGANLFEDGYRVHATAEPYVFVVTIPCKDGEKHHFLNVLEGTCSCPFHREQREGRPLTEDGAIIPCKHLEGLEPLVKQTIAELKDFGDLSYYRLRASWISVVAKRRGNLLRPQADYHCPEKTPYVTPLTRKETAP